ncbi:nitrilase-related carbon-nitrogen hydrolase [Hankyongella ginsenosidimutans]|uniref:nitrilase-related carbon-nitrogen hydrolase n=1 Tax=Hankyongella ginsenosidimutans TaxID=1763828 RepID=UPI0024830239|nr:nitrilase-related carbon-nitrogen hydrolase [Hankyongella ginsenosidimutans]
MTALSAAVVQAAPIPLDIGAGIAQAVNLIHQAADSGARVIGFGETFLGGYPLWLDEAPGAALWDHPGPRRCTASCSRRRFMPATPGWPCCRRRRTGRVR